jgi:hypothetical protein
MLVSEVSKKFRHLSFGMPDAFYQARPNERGNKKMKNSIPRKAAYIGAGSGLVLFAIFGLLPGSLIGGAAGINFAGMLFGLPLDPGIISRAIVLTSMLAGVLVAGIAMVTAASAAGWLLGRLIEAAAPQKAAPAVAINRK